MSAPMARHAYATGALRRFGMLGMWSDPTQTDTLSAVLGRAPELYNATATDANGTATSASGFTCGQDQLANKFVQQVIISFFSPKFSEVMKEGAKWMVAKVKGKKWLRGPFKLEKKFIRMIYIQGIFWIVLPFLPVMSIWMPLSLMLEFKYDKAFLLRLCNKQTTPFQGDNSQTLLLYLGTMLLFVTGWVYLWLNQLQMVDQCGPFYNATAAVSSAAYMVNALEGNTGFTAFYDYVLANTYLHWLVIAFLTLYLVNAQNRGDILREYSDEKAETDLLLAAKQQGKISRLEKQVARYKELTKAANEAAEDADSVS